MDADHWEFANDGFLSGKKHLLTNIPRKRSHSQSLKTAPVHQDNSISKCHHGETGKSRIISEIEQLKHDRNMMKLELVQLRQQQVSTSEGLQSIRERIQSAEHDQQQMMLCLKKAIDSPLFLSQLMQRHERKKKFAVKRKTIRVSEKIEISEIAGSNTNQLLRCEEISCQIPTSETHLSPPMLQRSFNNGHTRTHLEHEMSLSEDVPFELDATIQVIDDYCAFDLTEFQEDSSLAVICKDQNQISSTNDAVWEQFFNTSMDVSPYFNVNGCCKGQPSDG
jgi:hypothetical protein